MKTKIRITILVALAVLGAGLVLSAAASAKSVTTLFPDGSYAVTEDVSVSGPLAKGGVSSGDGGTPTENGWRDLYLSTRWYNVFGQWVWTVRTGRHWTWDNRHVTACSWYTPRLTDAAWLPSDMKLTWGYADAWWIAANGQAHWARYTSVDMKVTGVILKYGVWNTWPILHEYKVRGDGTYWWRTTVSG